MDEIPKERVDLVLTSPKYSGETSTREEIHKVVGDGSVLGVEEKGRTLGNSWCVSCKMGGRGMGVQTK